MHAFLRGARSVQGERRAAALEAGLREKEMEILRMRDDEVLYILVCLRNSEIKSSISGRLVGILRMRDDDRLCCAILLSPGLLVGGRRC